MCVFAYKNLHAKGGGEDGGLTSRCSVVSSVFERSALPQPTETVAMVIDPLKKSDRTEGEQAVSEKAFPCVMFIQAAPTVHGNDLARVNGSGNDEGHACPARPTRDKPRVSYDRSNVHVHVITNIVFRGCLGIRIPTQDAFAAESHARAHRAQEEGLFDEEIVPVRVS